MHWHVPQWVKYTVSVLLNMNSIYSKNGRKKKKLPMGRRKNTSHFHEISSNFIIMFTVHF